MRRDSALKEAPGREANKRRLKSPDGASGLLTLAEEVGFEPTDSCPSLVFKTSALNRSATLPYSIRASDSNGNRRAWLEGGGVGGQHFRRVFARGLGEFDAAQHAGDFQHPLFGVQRRDAAEHLALVFPLADLPMVFAA